MTDAANDARTNAPPEAHEHDDQRERRPARNRPDGELTMTAQQQQDLLAIVRAYGNACASTARTPPNSPARQAAARIENDRWSELEPALRAVVAERDNLVDAMREEIDEGLRLRELGGAQPDENITAMTERVIRERDALRAELDDAEVWRGLAIQFDAHRMQALWHLRTLISSADHADTARAFVAAPPLAGHEVVNERDALRARLAEIEAQEPGERQAVLLTDEQIERGRKQVFSTDNPFCPCDAKTMRKAARWAEAAVLAANSLEVRRG